LVNAADTHTLEALDTIGRCDRAIFANFVLQNFSVQQGGREHHKNQAEDGYRDHPDDLQGFPDHAFPSENILQAVTHRPAFLFPRLDQFPATIQLNVLLETFDSFSSTLRREPLRPAATVNPGGTSNSISSGPAVLRTLDWIPGVVQITFIRHRRVWQEER
jgi:hypothetical protein